MLQPGRDRRKQGARGFISILVPLCHAPCRGPPAPRRIPSRTDVRWERLIDFYSIGCVRIYQKKRWCTSHQRAKLRCAWLLDKLTSISGFHENAGPKRGQGETCNRGVSVARPPADTIAERPKSSALCQLRSSTNCEIVSSRNHKRGADSNACARVTQFWASQRCLASKEKLRSSRGPAEDSARKLRRVSHRWEHLFFA